MSLIISRVFTYDEDAGNYIQAVEAADGQALEGATRKAINNFVIGCKQDGIWNAIKASCILAGARTLAGALVPLVGAAPTNNGPFVSSDYNRKTGLIGNNGAKWLNSNRAGNADPQNNTHAAVYVSTVDGSTGVGYIGTTNTVSGSTNIGRNTSFDLFFRCQSSGFVVGINSGTGLIAVNRSSPNAFGYRANGATGSSSVSSQTPNSTSYGIFSLGNGAAPSSPRLAFYSIGESLDLALLDARVTALITALGAAIP